MRTTQHGTRNVKTRNRTTQKTILKPEQQGPHKKHRGELKYLQCRYVSNYQNRRNGTPLTGIAPPHVCAGPNQALDFHRHISKGLFMFNQLR